MTCTVLYVHAQYTELCNSVRAVGREHILWISANSASFPLVFLAYLFNVLQFLSDLSLAGLLCHVFLTPRAGFTARLRVRGSQ